MPHAITDIRSLARSYTELALRTLAGIAQHGTNESAQVAASVALLDRGWGKPTATIGNSDGEIRVIVRQIIRGADGRVIDATPRALEHQERGK
jgi:hypothetical protein